MEEMAPGRTTWARYCGAIGDKPETTTSQGIHMEEGAKRIWAGKGPSQVFL